MSVSKEVKDCTDEFLVEDAAPKDRDAPAAKESDPHRIAQRQKQIDMGKNTLGYQRYRQQVPRIRRKPRQDPMTPDVHQVCSKRSFDGQIKKWRRMLHEWDPKNEEEQENMEAGAAPASNPPAPATSDRSYEHITHEDCTEYQTAAVKPSPGSKNEHSLRSDNAVPPQKAAPQALRKRNFSELGTTCQSGSPTMVAHRPAAPSSKQAKTLTPVMQNSKAAAVIPASAVVMAASELPAPPTVANAEEAEVDYGEDEDWAYIDAEEAAAGSTVYNNWGAIEQDDANLDDIAV